MGQCLPFRYWVTVYCYSYSSDGEYKVIYNLETLNAYLSQLENAFYNGTLSSAYCVTHASYRILINS
jgi:hypothetical protein